MLETKVLLQPVVHEFLEYIYANTKIHYNGILVISSGISRNCHITILDGAIQKLTWCPSASVNADNDFHNQYEVKSEKLSVRVMSITNVRPWVFITPAEYISRHHTPFEDDIFIDAGVSSSEHLPFSTSSKIESSVKEWVNNVQDLGKDPVIIGWPISMQVRVSNSIVHYTRDLHHQGRVSGISNSLTVEDINITRDPFGRHEWDVTYTEPFASLYTCANLISLIRAYLIHHNKEEFTYETAPGWILNVTQNDYTFPPGLHASPKDIRVIYDLVYTNLPIEPEDLLKRLIERLKTMCKSNGSSSSFFTNKALSCSIIECRTNGHETVSYKLGRDGFGKLHVSVTHNGYTSRLNEIVIETLDIKTVELIGEMTIAIRL